MPSLIDNDPGGYTFTRNQWAERIAAFMPGGGDVFSLDSSEAVIEGDIPWYVRYSFIRTVLGYAYVSGNKLVRQIPLFHPWFDFLSAQSVSIVPYQNDTTSADTLKQAAWYPDIAFDQAGYNWARATIRFKQQPYDIYDDDDLTTYYDGSLEEWKRYCYDVHREGSLEVISQTGREMKFAEGPSPSPFVPKGIALPSEIGTFAYKDVIEYKWMFVPKEYVCGKTNPENMAFKKIDPCVGKLNKTEFLGYPKGTLLLNPPRVERFEWPLRTAESDGSAFGYHITLSFQHFDPPSGVSPQVYFGHNLLPWGGRMTNNAAPIPATYGKLFGKWFYATNDGETGTVHSLPLLEYAEFRNIFLCADATTPP